MQETAVHPVSAEPAGYDATGRQSKVTLDMLQVVILLQ